MVMFTKDALGRYVMSTLYEVVNLCPMYVDCTCCMF